MACNKRSYPSKEVAEDVLIETRTAYDYAPGSGPIAVYQCEECGNYHLTSRGPMNEKLAKVIADGRIQRQKEANRWMEKLRKK